MKVIIWGHPLHSHTHSYIHQAFYKAFLSMGFETYWMPDKPVNSGEFSDCLFLTEGQADKDIPLKADCKYILHNCDNSRYIPSKVILQVYTHDVRDRAKDNITYEKLSTCTYVERPNDGGVVLYQPWATDLLAGEIDMSKAAYRSVGSRAINWVGTIGGGEFGNVTELDGFRRACSERGYVFNHYSHVDDSAHRSLIESSYLAPAIVGPWQKEKGYIPCRIFKNISYGQLGLTNSESVNEIMEGKVIYNSDTYQLFHDAEAKKESRLLDTIDAMRLVASKHTYVNRIRTILNLF
jgi:hypothetical protein